MKTEKSNVASSIIAAAFEPKSVTEGESEVPTYSGRYLFTPPEYTMPDTASSKDYMQLLKRQSFHNAKIVCALSTDIEIDPDYAIITNKGILMTLRQMILKVKSHNKGDTKGLRLFHNIDYCINSKDLWMNGRKVPGGVAWVFTFYDNFEGETRRMIKGLGTYLSKIYGASPISSVFTDDHWDATEGWQWNSRTDKFITPESRQLKANINLDPNLILMQMAEVEYEKEELEKLKNQEKNKDKETDVEGVLAGQATHETAEKNSITSNSYQEILYIDSDDSTTDSKKINKEKIKKKKKKETGKSDNGYKKDESDSDTESQSTTKSQARRRRDIEVIKRIQDPDLDSVEKEEGMLNQINLLNKDVDQGSIASSITMGRSMEPDNRSNEGKDKEYNSEEQSLVSSVKTMDQKYFSERFDKSLTLEERRTQGLAHLELTMRQLAAAKTRVLEEALEEEERKDIERVEQRQSNLAAALPSEDTSMNSENEAKKTKKQPQQKQPIRMKYTKETKKKKTKRTTKSKIKKHISSSELVRGHQQDYDKETETPSNSDTGRPT